MKFKDTHGEGVITLNKRARAAILSHLSNASGTVLDQKHPLHIHLKKAAGELGAIVDRSEDDGEFSTPHDRNLTSSEVDRDYPARRLGAPQPEGRSEIATRAIGFAMDLFKAGPATFSARRDVAVKEVYKSAAREHDRAKKADLEGLAYELDRIDVRDLQQRAADVVKHNVVGSRRPTRSWMERHFGA